MRLFRPKPVPTLGAILGVSDWRDWDFPRLAQLVEAGDALPVSWDTPLILKQGPDECVGYSIATFCETSSSTAKAEMPVDLTLGTYLYQRAREIDQLPENVKGATLRSGLKAAQEAGLISNYARGDWESSTAWLRTKGAILFGIPWYKDMFSPKGGVVNATGSYQGGHAICNSGDNMTPEDRKLPNTWGPLWGKNGYCYMAEPDLYQCWSSGGEVWTAIRMLKAVPHWPDLPDMSEDDLKSQDACFVSGIMKGYEDGTFGVGDDVSVHQVGTVMVRLGVKKSNPWNRPADYTMPALRGWVHTQLPMLKFNEEDRWMEPLNRFQLMLLVGRYLRGA